MENVYGIFSVQSVFGHSCKLELADNNSGIQLKCERCGRPISSGRFCSRCLKVINDRLKIEPENEQRVKKNEKFHIQDRIKRH